MVTVQFGFGPVTFQSLAHYLTNGSNRMMRRMLVMMMMKSNSRINLIFVFV
jgi:hypothetical protein